MICNRISIRALLTFRDPGVWTRMHHVTAGIQPWSPAELLAAYLYPTLLWRLCTANLVLYKTIAGVAVVIDSVLLLQQLDVV
jgi:hypothetical protein